MGWVDLPSQPEKQEAKSLIGSLTPSRVRSRSPGSSLHGYGSLPHDLQRSLTPSPVPMPTPVQRKAHENRLLSDVWLTSAAVFRRMRRFDQAKDAIGEAEMLDENNPGVWIQVSVSLEYPRCNPTFFSFRHCSLVCTTWPSVIGYQASNPSPKPSCSI